VGHETRERSERKRLEDDHEDTFPAGKVATMYVREEVVERYVSYAIRGSVSAGESFRRLLDRLIRDRDTIVSCPKPLDGRSVSVVLHRARTSSAAVRTDVIALEEFLRRRSSSWPAPSILARMKQDGAAMSRAAEDRQARAAGWSCVTNTRLRALRSSPPVIRGHAALCLSRPGKPYTWGTWRSPPSRSYVQPW
jgi:hypothetical protein